MDTPQNMGLGKLANWTFLRAFRWLFTHEDHPEIHFWIHYMIIDYKNKTIKLKAYEDLNGDISKWLNDLFLDISARHAVIKHLDGLGNTLVDLKITGMDIIKHSIVYDYSSSGVLTHNIIFSYKNISRILKIEQK